jgi:translation initiation factor IF-3
VIKKTSFAAAGPITKSDLFRQYPELKRQSPPLVYWINEQGLDQGLQNVHQLFDQLNSNQYEFRQVTMRQGKPVLKLMEIARSFKKTAKLLTPGKTSSSNNPGLTEKEVTMGSNVASHDLQLKIKKIQTFLMKGYRVKISVMKKGKYVPGGGDPMELVQECMSETALCTTKVIKPPQTAGRQTIVILQGKKSEVTPSET